MYAKCGEIKGAEDVFNESTDGNVASWTSLIVGYVQNDCVEEEVILFNKMRDGLVAGNQFTLGSLVTGWERLGALYPGKWPTALLDMNVKCGNAIDARSVSTCLSEADLVSWTAMIIGYTQLGHPSKALKLLVDKRWIGILPNFVTTASVLSAPAPLGHLNMGKTVHCLGTATASSWMDKQGRKSLLSTSFSGMATSMLLLSLSFTWKARGDHHRNVCSILVSAHGTNPASAARCGMKIVSVGIDAKGNINMEDSRRATEANQDNLGSKLTTVQLVKPLILTTWGNILSTAFLALLYSLASYVGSYLIDTLVQYLDGRQDINNGYVLVSAFLVAKLVECLLRRHWFLRVQKAGIKASSVLVVMIYNKGLTLSCQSKQGHSTGEIINFRSIDAQRVSDFSWYMHDPWIVIVQIAVTSFLFWGAPIFVSVATLGTGMFMRIPLESGKTLSALATFRILQEPISNLPDPISMIIQTKVSLDRIASFISLDDLQLDITERLPRASSDIAVEIIGGNFSWDLSLPDLTQKDIDLRVCHGLRVAICGAVGTDKGELSVCESSFAIFTKSSLPLPDKYHGLTDVAKRHRQQYVDMIVNPEVAAVFQKRAKIVSKICKTVGSLGFVEIDIPVLRGAAGGVEIFPIEMAIAASEKIGSSGNKKKVVVVGGGIAGSLVAKRLQLHAHVTLIDPKEYLRITWASLRAMVEPSFGERSLINYKDFLPNVQLVTSTAANITDGEVLTAHGDRILYDFLIIATGHADDSSPVTRSERLLQYQQAFKKIQSASKILIIGGGPTGVELAGEISVEFPEKKVIMVHRGSRLLEFIGCKASKKALDWLISMKVEVILDQSINLKLLSDGVIQTFHGETIKVDCYFDCSGKPIGSSWLRETFLRDSLDIHGRLAVDKNLRVKNHKNIFGIGDITNIPEIKQGFLAIRHAEVAARNLKLLLKGRNETKLVSYKPGRPMAFVSLGRREAVAQVCCLTVSGWLPGMIKSRDIYVGKTRKIYGL
ncbi:hypothetical protein Nepgr_001337 [Nepenthes gracilis]|uniref:ABC transmembrane type-1 domain-containing protein n=1 Tax=Nepenthes gracilis TaxID=150966 RepID=A0AAD3P6Y9_NEPGR|nr:hypothetical protein Nepgr_001337 [Nepenthes gracilis]